MTSPTFLPRRKHRAGSPTRPHWWVGAMALALALFTSAPLLAQTGQITGTITSQGTAQALADVQVNVQGTTIGTTTNQDGGYILFNVPVGEQTIVAQLIGYGAEEQTITVTAGTPVTADFLLQTRAVELEGMIVTGTPIAAQKREIGNSISLITSEQIASLPAQSLGDILRGRTLGVSVSGSTSQPGAGSRVTLRGLNSISGRNEPLVYIDGVRMMSDAWEGASGSLQGGESVTGLSGINPSDIDRIEVIKGAAASTLYGTEASAGVIQIFTKRGRAGAPRWSVNLEQTINRPTHVGPESDPTGLQINQCDVRGPFWPDSIPLDPTCPENGSWLKTGYGQSADLSVRGGSEDLTYYLSSGWERETSVINWDNDGAQSFNLRANFQFNGFEDLQIRFNSNYRRQDIEWLPQGDNGEGHLFNVVRLFEDETENADAEVFGKLSDQIINHFNFSSNMNWSPMDNFQHRLNVGVDYSNSHYTTKRVFGYFDDETGTRTVDIEARRFLTMDYAASFSSGVPGLSDDFTSVLSVGGQYNASEDTGNRTDVQGTAGPGNWVLEHYEEVTNYNEDYAGRRSGGFFLQEQFGWANRLFITAGFRADSHSDFGEELENKYFFLVYPKISMAYTVSDHDFWPSWWTTSRIRGAYGESGEPPSPGIQVVSFQASSLADENQLGFIVLNQGNPEVGPEISREWEVGLDGSFLNDRIGYEITRWDRETIDGLVNISPPPSNGIAESVTVNLGNWGGFGYEASTDFLVLDALNTQLSLNGRYQYTETEMGRLSNIDDTGINLGGYGNRYEPGSPMPAYIDNILLNPDSVGQLPEYSDEDLLYGPTYPPHEASLGITATLWNRLTLDTFLFSQWGHLMIDDMAQEIANEGRWLPCKDVNERVEAFLEEEPGASIDGITAKEIAQCSEDYANNRDWILDGDYIRLGTASASFRMPESWLDRIATRIDQATLQFQISNLFSWTKDEWASHPDAVLNTVAGVDRAAGYILPPPRRFTLNLRATF